MKSLLVVMFCCFSAVCMERPVMLEVSGHVGGEVFIQCSGSWTSDNSSEHHTLYFCRGPCSRGKALIQTEAGSVAVSRRGRYSIQVNRGAFNVTIRRLRRADAGTYHCGVDSPFDVLYQREVNLALLEAATVLPGSPPYSSTQQTEADTLSLGRFPFSTEKPSASSTLPATQEETNQQATARLTDTTVVIIVSVSMALLVCAIIPLIFYCRSNTGQNRPATSKGPANYCEENADVASAQAAVSLQSLEPDADLESSAQDSPHYAAIYQALDPQSLD